MLCEVANTNANNNTILITGELGWGGVKSLNAQTYPSLAKYPDCE